jgi:hypothetical protein
MNSLRLKCQQASRFLTPVPAGALHLLRLRTSVNPYFPFILAKEECSLLRAALSAQGKLS